MADPRRAEACGREQSCAIGSWRSAGCLGAEGHRFCAMRASSANHDSSLLGLKKDPVCSPMSDAHGLIRSFWGVEVASPSVPLPLVVWLLPPE